MSMENLMMPDCAMNQTYPTIIAMSVTTNEVTENIPLIMLTLVNHWISSYKQQ